ncbi:MAG: pilus assembly protein [Sphingomonadales bacterium]|nr:pilus assembly protein [Sphingomonadales bacterium]MDE2568021.1 pilus assembly protein [Sphingomonadales bacterium]
MGFDRHFWRDQAGSPAVEMVLVLPLLLVLIFTCLEGAHYLYVEHQVVKGVRDGARFAARQGFSNYTCTTINSTVVTNTKEITRTGEISGGTSRVQGWTDSDIMVIVTCPSTAVTTGIYSDMTNAPRVTVSATVTYPSLFGVLSGLTSSFKLNAADQAAVMGV